MSRDIEIMVDAVAQMTQYLEAVQQDYLRMKAIIEAEKEYIASRDLDAHERHVQRKTQVGQSIIEKAEKMMMLWRNMRVRISPPDGDKRSHDMSNITDLIKHVQDWTVQHEASDLAKKVLLHAIEKLKNRLDAFAVVRENTNPEIEANAYLVERLLQRHHDFRRFIQHEIDGASAVYNAKGFQGAKDSLPMLRVRA